MSELGDKLRAIADEIDKQQGTTPVQPDVVYPAMVIRSDVNMLVKEALAEDYLPTGNAWIFGHGEHYVGEPSNAPDGYPRRSAHGYPLSYPMPLGPDGKPTGPARVMYGDSSYDNEQQVLDLVKSMPDRIRMMIERDRAAAALVHPGPIPADCDDDTKLALCKASTIPGCGSIGYQLVNGTRADLGRIINWGLETNIGKVNAFDLAGYSGPYKAVIDAYIASHKVQ